MFEMFWLIFNLLNSLFSSQLPGRAKSRVIYPFSIDQQLWAFQVKSESMASLQVWKGELQEQQDGWHKGEHTALREETNGEF